MDIRPTSNAALAVSDPTPIPALLAAADRLVQREKGARLLFRAAPMGLMLSRLQILVSVTAVVSLVLISCKTESPKARKDNALYEAQWRAAYAHITNCAVCKGPLVTLKSIGGPGRLVSDKNLRLWNQSICADLLVGPDSLICKRCWHLCVIPEVWTRVLNSASEFKRPLNPVILNAPMPKRLELYSGPVFTQTYRSNRFEEEVFFECEDKEALRARLTAYGTTNQVNLRLDRNKRFPRRLCVTISAVN